MEIYKAYKFRLYPTRQQRDYFNRCIGCGRFVYNWALSMRINAYKEDGTTLYILKDIKPKIPLLKEEQKFFASIGVFTVGHPTLEQSKAMDEFMATHCKFYDNKGAGAYDPMCKLSDNKCDTLPSKCIYRKIYAKAVDDIKKKLEDNKF